MTDTFSAIKDPDSVEDFTIDWAATLAESSPADTISTSAWSKDTALVIDSDSNTTTTATVWVSGGTDGTYTNLVNRVTTAAGRTLDRTIVLLVQNT